MRYHCRALLLIGVGSSAHAQSITTVRIAESGTKAYSKDACTITTKPQPITNGKDAKDTVHVVIQNDQNQEAKAPETIAITVGTAAAQIAKDATHVDIASAKVGNFTNTSFTATRSNAVAVCSLTVPPTQVPLDENARQFRVGIGATFDFLNGISATDLYSDATVYLPQLWHTDRTSWGIDAGLWNGRSTSGRTKESSSREIVTLNATRDTIVTFRQTTQLNRQTAHEQLAQYITLMWNHDPAFSWALLHAEGVRDKVTIVTSAQVTVADTIRSLKPANFTNVALPVDVDTNITSAYTAFIGTGPMLHVQRGNLEFRTKSLVGWIGSPSMHSNDGAFFILQCRVTDFENGFKIGGDIRGRFKGADPAVVVYLSKDFSFARFADFLAGGDKSK